MPFTVPNGKIATMNLTIDRSGRIVVPKPIRDRFGLTPDTELQIIEQPDGLLLKRVEERPSMIKVDGLWVHQGVPEPGANWDRVVDDAREERIDSILKA
jgi:AbrB family looped-hinge helix DNA binding protein